MAKLSVLYIVRNEQDLIEKSLKSIQPIADEIVIIDSGSFDKTLSICRKFSYIRIFSHAWVHDFSQIKNYGIKQCAGDWILCMDADEVLDPASASAIRTAVNGAKPNVAGFDLHIVDHESAMDPQSPANPTPFFKSPQTRLFRKHNKIAFQGKVAERIDIATKKVGAIDLIDAKVHHFLWRGKGHDYKDGRLRYYEKLGASMPVPAEDHTKSPQSDTAPSGQVAIIVPVFNGLGLTKDCIYGISCHTKGAYTLHLIDNGSNDGTFEYLKNVTGKTPQRFIKNVGVARAKNAGAREALSQANTKYICFMDNDAKPVGPWLEALTAIMDANPKIGMVGPLSNTADGPQNLYTHQSDASKPLPKRDPEFFQVDSINGFCMLVRSDVFRKIGFFDESFGTYGFDDKDFCRRVKQAGFEIAIANRVFIEHKGRGTMIENRLDWTKIEQASSVKYAQKWSGSVQPTAMGPRSPALQREQIRKVSKYSIIILTHNRLDVTKPCIESILETSSNYELIIIDNKSTDGTVEWIRAKVPSAIIIENDSNLGVPKARNQGIRAATTNLLVIMDNDIVLKHGWEEELFGPLKGGYDMVGIEGWQLDSNWSACYKCQSSHDRFDYLGGACTIFKREVFEKTGLFDEGFSPAYYEDSIEGKRMVPIKIGNIVDVVPIEHLFEMGKITTRSDGKEESIIEGVMTPSVDPNKPHPHLDINNLPNWWTKRFLSDKERKAYSVFAKTGNWSKAEVSLNRNNKGMLKHRINKRLQRSYREDATAKWMPIQKLVRHKTTKPMVRVDSRYGQTVCTEDHSLMCWDEVKLKESRPRDSAQLCSIVNKIDVPESSGANIDIRGGTEIKKNLLEFKNVAKGNHYRFPNYINYDSSTADNFFEMLGWYLSEGSVSSNSINIHTTDKVEFDAICSCMESIIGRKPNVCIYKDKDRNHLAIRGKIVRSRHEFAYRASICKRDIAEFFERTCGKGAANKKIPSFVYTAPYRLKMKFLSGLLRGDAYNFNLNKSSHEQAYSKWYKDNAFKFTTISLKLASGLCFLLSTMDKRYSVRYDDQKKAYMVDFVAYRRNKRKSNIKVTTLGPCTSYVYDIVVPETHTFVDAMGMLVVHNTDLSIRAKMAGLKLAWVPSKKLVHKEHSTLVYGQKSFNYQQAIAKSHTHFQKKMKGEIRVVHETLPPLGKMFKILYLGMYYDYGVRERGTSFEQANFFPALKQWSRTSEFAHFDFVDIGKTYGIAKMSDMLLERVDLFKPDVVFTVFFDENHDPRRETLKRISAHTKTIGWFCDSHFRYDNFDRPWADALSYNVTTSASAYQRYVRDGLGLKVIKSQWGSSPAYANLGIPKEIDVSFVGQPHGDRRQVIDEMRRAGINIQTFGTGWDRRLSFEETVRMFNISKINLNLNNACDTRFKQIKGRNFEVPGCGGFLLTGLAENLGDYYDIGKEIVTFDSTPDMIEKIRYYLAHDEEREAIAKAGYARTMKDHTFATRLDHIFTKIGLL